MGDVPSFYVVQDLIVLVKVAKNWRSEAFASCLEKSTVDFSRLCPKTDDFSHVELVILLGGFHMQNMEVSKNWATPKNHPFSS